MSSDVAVQPFAGAYQLDTAHSTFGFDIRYAVSTFHGTLSDVDARVVADDDGVTIEGSAKVESISITEPEQFRAHVLAPDFFDAANHPEVTFRSTDAQFDESGAATVRGDLTIAGVTRSVTATGTYGAPVAGMGGFPIASLELETTFDRRDFGMDWQAELPNGQPALDWDVTLKIALRLFQPAA